MTAGQRVHRLPQRLQRRQPGPLPPAHRQGAHRAGPEAHAQLARVPHLVPRSLLQVPHRGQLLLSALNAAGGRALAPRAFAFLVNMACMSSRFPRTPRAAHRLRDGAHDEHGRRGGRDGHQGGAQVGVQGQGRREGQGHRPVGRRQLPRSHVRPSRPLLLSHLYESSFASPSPAASASSPCRPTPTRRPASARSSLRSARSARSRARPAASRTTTSLLSSAPSTRTARTSRRSLSSRFRARQGASLSLLDLGIAQSRTRT